MNTLMVLLIFCLTIVHTSASQTSLIPLKISSTLQKFVKSHKRRLQTDVTLSKSGYCRSKPGGSVITTASACATALSSVIDEYVGVDELNLERDSSSPPGCYYVTGGRSCEGAVCLVFNSRTNANGKCNGGSYGGFTCVCHVNCPTGKYHGSSCATCSSGQYNDQTGRPSCKSDCNAGSYITSDKKLCKPCEKGKWQDQNDKSTCKECNIGMYGSQTKQTSAASCKDDCGAGSYIAADKSACSLCKKGQWQDFDDQTSCKSCGDGKYNDLSGQKSDTCKDDCGAGSYITADKSECSSCQSGFYNEQVGQSSCKRCASGKTTTKRQATSKDDCTTTSSSSSSRSSYNDNDYYDDDDDSYNNNNNYSSSGGGTSVFVQILLYYLLPILGSCLLSCLFNQLLYKMGCKKRKEEQLAQGIEIPRTAVLPMVPPVPVQPDLATMLEGVRKEYGAGSIEYKMALDMAQEHILSSE